MTTAIEFQAKLKSLQEEQKTLLASPDRRKKIIRLRIQEITREFYATRTLWRNTLGPTTAF
jgi:hypothetical protein